MRKRLLLTAFLILIGACATTDKDKFTPEQAFKDAREPYDDENFDIAINRLGEFKSRYPYSHFASEAELMIANSHFELKRYIEASAAYEQFKTLHPTHEKVPFAMYRIGECFWQDAPEAVDREQDFTRKAIDQWQSLIEEFPAHELALKSQELIKEGQKRMALANEFVAKFYCRQDVWHACARRSMQLVADFSQFPRIVEDALFRAAKALRKMTKERKDDKDDSNYFFATMSNQDILEKANQLEKRAHALKKSNS